MADSPFDPDKWLSETSSPTGTSSFDPDKWLANAPEKKEEIGGLESFGRGAAQAFALGYSPQMIAAIKTGNLPFSENPEYVKELAKQKAATEQAWEQHPWLYGSGMVASAVPAVANAILAGPEELAAAGTIGGLGGLGLRTVAGKGAGAAPTALRGAATAAENPIVQGAVYGSSEGETLGDKLSGAAAGAVGAKVAPMALGAAGSAVKAVGAKIAPDIVDPIFHVLTGNPETARTAGNIASDLGVSLPGATVSESAVQGLGMKSDFLNQVPKAANRTLGEIGDLVSDYSNKADVRDSGAKIRAAVQNWATDATKPTGFEAQMNAIYQPVRVLEQSSAVVPIRSLQSEIIKQAQSNIAKLGNINPTLDIANSALTLNAQNGGLTFSEMQALKKILSDKITWNQAPGGSNIDNNILKNLRAALDSDMQTYATKIGGKNVGQTYGQIKSQAKDLYDQRDSIFKLTGNPVVGGPGAKDEGAIYRSIISAAGKKGGGNLADLKNLQAAVSKYDPAAWESVGRSYAADIAPNGQFSFNNFNKLYDGYFHPQGKDLIFGPSTSSPIRKTFDTIKELGSVDAKNIPLGVKLDSLAARAAREYAPVPSATGAGTALLEHAFLGGLPLNTMTAGALGAASGRFGARNIATPESTYLPSKAAQIAGETVKQAAPLVGAQMATESPLPGFVKAGVPYAVKKITDQLPTSIWNAPGSNSSDVRYGRKSGGRVSDKLVAAAERAKKNINNKTESLLNVPDTHVAHALELANKFL